MSNLTTNTSDPTNDTFFSSSDEFPLLTSTSDAWAQVIANIGTLLVLVGEKNVKAYFKTMHNPSYYALFASSPIGLVTSITTLIRLSNNRITKRLIGRQFEPWAQVLLDVTSVSAGPVGLQLLNGILEPSITPDPENVASFWIRGEKNGSADELITWTRGTADFLYKRAARQDLEKAKWDSCYDRRAGLATANAFRGNGPCAVWIAREKALDSWKAMRPVLAPHNGYIHGGTGELNTRCSELKELCRDESNNIDPDLGNTSCKGVGLAIAHWTDVSPALTTSENYQNSVLNKLRYFSSGLFILADMCIVAAMDRTGHEGAWEVGIELFVISAGCWVTAWCVDKASAEESVDLSCFGGTAAGFVSRQNPRGVQLRRCPERVVISENARGSDGFQNWGSDGFQNWGSDGPQERGNYGRIMEGWLVALVVLLMAGGFCYLYLSLRKAPVWAPISVILVAGISSCVRSMCEPEALPEKNGIPAIPYFQAGHKRSAVPCALSFQDELDRMGWAKTAAAAETDRAAVKTPTRGAISTAAVAATATATATAAALACIFPRGPADPLVLSHSYIVLVPDVCVLGEGQQQLLWNIDDDLMKGFFFRALQLAHSMRVQSIAPVEVGRFGRGDGPLARTELVFLYCDVLVPEHVLRQSIEVLVSPAADIRTPSLMLEQICIAVFTIANRAFRVPGYEVGGATLGLGVGDAQNYQVINQKTLQTIPWEEDMSWKAYTPLTWVAAKIIYVTMLKVSGDVMMQLGMQWFGGFEELSNNDITGFLRSMQQLGLVVGRNDS